MPTATTRPTMDDTLLEATLLVAFDLGNAKWTLALTPTLSVPLRLRTSPPVIYRAAEFEAARRHFGLPPLAGGAPLKT